MAHSTTERESPLGWATHQTRLLEIWVFGVLRTSEEQLGVDFDLLLPFLSSERTEDTLTDVRSIHTPISQVELVWMP